MHSYCGNQVAGAKCPEGWEMAFLGPAEKAGHDSERAIATSIALVDDDQLYALAGDLGDRGFTVSRSPPLNHRH